VSQPTSNPAAKKARQMTDTRVGIVVSDKRDKTRTVAVDFQVQHAKYGKYLRRRAKFHVHDEDNQSRQGDRVEIASCRPLSKTKAWRLIRVLRRGFEDQHRTEA
jgi:small subunit ribosomal protein S17